MNRLALLTIAGALASGCPDVPEEDVLRLSGGLERAATIDQTATVNVDYASKNARGEWWPCDLRLTATACVGDRHVNVYVSPPNVTDFDLVGGAACTDGEGNAFGAYEILKAKLDDGETPSVPNDLSVLILIASDADANGTATLENDDEVKAASVLGEGTVEIVSIGEFDDPVSLQIDGKTTSDRAVSIEVNGPTTPVTQIPTLDVARTCVEGDALE